jgi:WhiB family redox-sensing transcriptional regulator
MRDDGWQRDAACQGASPEMFFPVGHSPLGRAEAWAAKRICSGCPVRTPCLEWAIRTGESTGVWGGMTEEERRAEVKRRRRADLPA